MRRHTHQRAARAAALARAGVLDLRNRAIPPATGRASSAMPVCFRGPWNATLTWVTLLAIARAAIRDEFGLGEGPGIYRSRESGDVCLRVANAARCIGSVEPRRPLGEDVRANAVTAAFHDRGFRRSVRTNRRTATRYRCSDRASPFPARMRMTPRRATAARDRWRDPPIGRHRATFCRRCGNGCPTRVSSSWRSCKAGLPADSWNNVTLARYTVSKFSERARWSN
jgi:hypothetical protein